MSRLRLGVLGLSGRMGKEIAEALATEEFRDRFELVSAPKRGEKLDPIFSANVVVEFSSPEAALSLAKGARAAGKILPIVMGSTGWTKEQERELETLAKSVPILRASNYSVGVFLCRKTLESWTKWAGVDEWKVSIREVHHTRKKDAPSGTALTLATTLEGSGRGKVPIESVREGDVVGIHEVSFESAREKISLIHEAKSRAVFAVGALEAAEKFFGKMKANSLPKRVLSLEDIYSA